MLAQVKQHTGFCSDVVGPEGAMIFELSTGKHEPLLLRTNSLLISELLLDVFNGIRSFNLERDGCSGEAVESTDIDPHARRPVKHKIEDRFCLDAMLPQRTATFKLLAIKDEALLVWRNGFLVMDLGLDSFDLSDGSTQKATRVLAERILTKMSILPGDIHRECPHI